jgi:hypothetical protein
MSKVRISGDLEFVGRDDIGTAHQIRLRHGNVTIAVLGQIHEVNALVTTVPAIPADPSDKPIEVKKSYASEVQRALVTLGFSEAERGIGRGLETFSRWVDRLQVLLDVSEELKATWTQFMAAQFGSKDSFRNKESVDHAASLAWHAVTAQLRYFPPRARTGLDDGPLLGMDLSGDDHAGLSAWRETAKLYDIGSPKEFADMSSMSFGEFVDRKVVREWQDETGEKSPKLAGQRIASLVNDVHGQSQRIQALLDERELWRERTNCFYPKEFVFKEREWIDATQCDTPAKARIRIDSLYESDERRARAINEALAEIENWKKETGCLTATGAGELIKNRDTRIEDLLAKLGAADRVWRVATGCSSPQKAEDRIVFLEARISEAEKVSAILGKPVSGEAVYAVGSTALHEMRTKLETAQAKNEELSAKLHERDQDLLTANAEIDRVKAAARTLGLVSDDAKELAKVRAELQSKCREAQTERERADNELRRFNDAHTAIEGMRDALKIPKSFDWKSLPDHAGDIRRDRDELLVKLETAIIPQPKPERVEPGQKWAFVMTAKSTVSEFGCARFTSTDEAQNEYLADSVERDAGFYLGK